MNTVYSFKCDSIGPFNYLNVYNMDRGSLKKAYKFKNGDIFVFYRNLRNGDNETHSSDLAEIAYVNNGGSLIQGYIKYKDLSNSLTGSERKSNKLLSMCKITKKIYFKKLTKQPESFRESGVIFSRNDMEILLGTTGENNYNKCFDIIINRIISDLRKKEKDNEKLYMYWRNNCHSNYNFYRLEQGDQFVNISIDYDSIKKSKEKLNKELLRMFSLFRK